MNLKTAFGIILKDLRKTKKMSQEAFAFECGYDRTYISLLERGIRQPSIETVFKMSKALELQPSEFILKVEVLLQNEQ